MGLFGSKKQKRKDEDKTKEIDSFLRERGHDGFQAVLRLINSRPKEQLRIITDNPEGIDVLVHENMWFINERVLSDKRRMKNAFLWLACEELEVPERMREAIMDSSVSPLGWAKKR